jgi:hypothetical protein
MTINASRRLFSFDLLEEDEHADLDRLAQLGCSGGGPGNLCGAAVFSFG